MIPTQRQLELRLLLTADPSVAHRAMQLLEADANKVDEAAKRAKRSLGDVGPRQPGILAGVGSTLAAAPGAAMGVAGTAAGWLAAAGAVAATAVNLTHAFGQIDNHLLTTREKALGFARALPIIGDALAGLINNAMNALDRLEDPETAKRVDRDKIALPIELAQHEAAFGIRQRRQALGREIRDAQHQLEAIQKYPHLDYRDRIAMRNPNPLIGAASAIAIGGFREVQDPRLRDAEEAIQMARRGVAAASYGATGAYNDVGPARKEWQTAWSNWQTAVNRSKGEAVAAKDSTMDERDAAYERTAENARRYWGHTTVEGKVMSRYLGGVSWLFPTSSQAPSAGSYMHEISQAAAPGSASAAARGTNFSHLDAINQEVRAEQQAKQALQLLEEKISASKEKQLNLLQKQAELNRAITGHKKTQLSILDEELARSRQGAQDFGSLSKSEQFDFLGAARRFRAGGRESVAGDELARLSANPVTAGLVQDKLRVDTKGNAMYQELLQLAGVRDEQTIADLRKEVKAQVDIQIQVDEEQFARVMAEKLKQMNLKELIGEVLIKQLELEMRRPQRESERGRLERGN